MSKPALQRSVRCAIYTRKSTDERLDQDFNSLEAQREACAAYILSQKHEGWSASPERYDDGGFSGGSMDRPALQRLLADVEAGHIDVVVVYKVDRLTRSLSDFARIVTVLDKAEASFVSITQAFNTTTSMGRLTLNVLLSFAQFEREVTAERIRDKIAASKRKGMWMGGVVPIGYRAEDRKLVPEPEEARLVQSIFARYLALGSVQQLKAELDAAGLRTPVRQHRNDRQSGGAPFSRGKLYAMLCNPIYAGRIRHKGEVHPGQQPAIIDEALWQAVQERLAANQSARAARTEARAPSPLAGRLFDPDGRKMRPTHASKNGRRYRYYVSSDLIEGSVATGARGWRIPADELEGALARVIVAQLRDPGFASGLIAHGHGGTESASDLLRRTDGIAARLNAPHSADGRHLLRALVTRVKLSESELRAEISFAGLGATAGVDGLEARLTEVSGPDISAPIRLTRRGAELRLVLQGAAAAPRCPDRQLVKTLIEARCRVAAYMSRDRQLTVRDLAEREGAHIADVSRSLQLAFLAPDIVESILDGSQPAHLTAEQLKRIGELPLCWNEQRARLT